ncbi:unnamed protein product [Rotaria sp. Silwood2]|nr:unnamed protein product [Rotaria sp. Silwood2]
MEEENGKDVHKLMNQMLSSTPTFEIVRQQRFEVGPRYTDLKFIGEGAYVFYLIRFASLKDIELFIIETILSSFSKPYLNI